MERASCVPLESIIDIATIFIRDFAIETDSSFPISFVASIKREKNKE